jgi:hypothetical protein
MTPQEIQERNEQIALMLGYVNTTPADKDFNIFEYPTKFGAIPKMIETMSMKFHSDWNWLMEAVEFIEKLKFNTKACIHCNNDRVYLNTYPTEYSHSARFTSMTNSKVNFCYALEPTKKQAVFIAVSDFAQKLNNKEL